MAQASSPRLRPLDMRIPQRKRAKKAVNDKRTRLTEHVNSFFVGGVAPRDAFNFSIHPTPEAQSGDGTA